MKKWIFALFSLLLLSGTVCAETMTFEKEVEEIVANDQSREQVEAFALQKAKRLAVEEAGTYISSLTVVTNMRFEKEEITALASGVVQAKIVGVPEVKMENSIVHVKVKARIQVDTAILDRQVAELLKEKGTLKKLEEEQKKVRELETRLANLKSTELKRMEELNAQAIALEQERERRRLANAEMALKAQGELKKAEIERLQKEREIQRQAERMLADQEQQRKAEAETLAKEQDRLRRAQLENEQRWNDLTRKSRLAQQQWVPLDDTLSLRQALEEAKSIRSEIATLRQRSEFQGEESLRTLEAAYRQQIAATAPKMPPPLSEKDPFESTAEYGARLKAFQEKVKEASGEAAQKISRLKGEEALRLAQARQEYLEQQIKVLRPFIDRLKALQSRTFVLSGEPVKLELGTPDADRNCFPTTITHRDNQWKVDWSYADRDKARDIYQTRTFLKSVAIVQLDNNAPEGYAVTKARVLHPGTGEEWLLELSQRAEFEEISAFDSLNGNDLNDAAKAVHLAENNLKSCLDRDDKDVKGFRFCGEVVLDTKTGLMWTKNGDLFHGKVHIEQAKQLVSGLSYGGHTDWRLPTIYELIAMRKRATGEKNPAQWFNEIGFEKIYYAYSDYVSATGFDHGDYAPHHLYTLNLGSHDFKEHEGYTGRFYVWPVRKRR